MPGYEISRFVNLTQADNELLVCLICHDIFRNPVVAPCCLQTFCEDCIGDWLETNSTCPNDRQTLNKHNLTPAPRMVVNMIGKLQITCDYEANGCREIVALENLQSHSLQCN